MANISEGFFYRSQDFQLLLMTSWATIPLSSRKVQEKKANLNKLVSENAPGYGLLIEDITWPCWETNFIFSSAEILSAREDNIGIPKQPCNVLFTL